MLCQACRELSNTDKADAEGFAGIETVKSYVDSMSGDASITEQDLLDLCDTEGSPSNGGGTFDLRPDENGKDKIRWVPDQHNGLNPQYRAVGVGAPGEIGSPLLSQASLRNF